MPRSEVTYCAWPDLVTFDFDPDDLVKDKVFVTLCVLLGRRHFQAPAPHGLTGHEKDGGTSAGRL